jgi:hypothetical protein
MEIYKNINGKSSVRRYSVGSDYIQVMFSDGWTYEYTYSSAGSGQIDRMKELARQGSGLNSFIMLYVKKNYARKWR